MKNIIAVCAVIAAAFALPLEAKSPKYVFLFIGDGMSTPQRMVSEEYSRAIGRGPLEMNALPCQSITRTRSANSLITDSAASATAIACGEKTNNGALGIDVKGRRLESVAEIAHKKGMKVGIITTVTIVHATPAGFYAHRKSRGEFYNIGLDLVDSGFDFFAGGGLDGKNDDKKNPNYRGDIFDLAEKAGYKIVTDKDGLSALKPGCGKVWGVFSNGALEYSINSKDRHPTLAAMVEKGIELLDGPQGFFIMAEGGKLDWAAHANDPATVVKETLALDDAVKVALAFAEKHPDETLIVTTGDHETGGMAMGFAGLGYKFHVKLLEYQKCSVDVFSDKIGKMIQANPGIEFKDVKDVVTENFGLVFDKAEADTDEKKLLLLKTEEIKELERAFKSDVESVSARKSETKKYDSPGKRRFAATVKRIFSDHAGVGWTTGAHTALPTLTNAKGCGAEVFTGFFENTDIAHKLKVLLK